jgi:hypothetical protein
MGSTAIQEAALLALLSIAPTDGFYEEGAVSKRDWMI